MNLEAQWHQLDALVRVEVNARLLGAKRSAHFSQLVDRRHELLNTRRSAADFLALRDSQLPTPELITFKTGWLAAHLWPVRPWCVGMQIVQRNGSTFRSPLVEQLTHMGHHCDGNAAQKMAEVWGGSKISHRVKLDAVCLPQVSGGGGILVKAISYSSMRSMSPSLRSSQASGLLFPTSSRIIHNCYADGSVLNSLSRTQALLSAACPSVKWKSFILIVDDDFSWQFQLHDVSELCREYADSTSVAIDDYCVKSSVDYLDQLSKDADYFQRIPHSTTGTSSPTLDMALQVGPLDRYIRSMVHLGKAANEQSGEPRLVGTDAVDFHNYMESSIGLRYPRDMRRHDLEDCLRGGGWMKRLPHRQNAYGITDAGLVRYLTMVHKYNKMAPIATDILIDMAHQQAGRWSQLGSGGFGLLG